MVRVAGWGSRGQAMVDPVAAARGGLLDWWYDGGKRQVDLDLDRADGQQAVRDLAAHADLVFDDAAPGWLADRGIDHADLAAANPRLVHVSLTPFGRTGPRASWRTSDLVAAALGGVASVTGLADAPMNSWGGQNLNFGGFMAAISGLAALHRARLDGYGQHVDVSLHEVVASSVENLWFQWWYHDLLPDLPEIAARQGSLHWLGAYEVAPCRTGAVMITPTPTPDHLFRWMVEDGVAEAAHYLHMTAFDLLPQMADIMAMVERWVLTQDAADLFAESQRRHVAFGEVQDVATVAVNPQFAFRGFFQDHDWDGPPVRRPGHPGRTTGTPPPPLRPPAAAPTPVAEIVAGWTPAEPATEAAPATTVKGTKPLDGLLIADFTWVLAGPFATRILGDLGADVVKFQTEGRATQVNRPDYPYFATWNRSKRSAALDMKHPGALDAVRPIIERADVLIENYSAGVLDRWGLDWETVRAWNPRLIYVTMAGPGHDGPWKDVISYAPTVHALCGLTYLTNPPGRLDVGPGFSLNDHAAGFVAATLVLEAIEARRRTGEGQLIDIAQLEVGSYLCGPALVEHFANGRTCEPGGNVDALVDNVPNEIYADGHGGWLAVSVLDDAQWVGLCRVLGRDDLAADPTLATVEGRRARRADVDAAVGAWVADRAAPAAMVELQETGVPAGAVQDARSLEQCPQLQARDVFRSFADHPLFGDRAHERFPAIFSESDLTPYLRSPYLGEHNFEVYGELAGLSDEDIAIGIGDELFG